MRDRDDNFNPRYLYRDTDRALLAGVVAGIAHHFGFGVGATRCVVILMGLFFGPFVILAYIVGALLLKPMPRDTFKTQEEEVFWREIRKSPKATYSAVRFRLRQIEQSLQRMERYVTSPRFKLDRDFRNLEERDGQ